MGCARAPSSCGTFSMPNAIQTHVSKLCIRRWLSMQVLMNAGGTFDTTSADAVANFVDTRFVSAPYKQFMMPMVVPEVRVLATACMTAGSACSLQSDVPACGDLRLSRVSSVLCRFSYPEQEMSMTQLGA